MFKLLLIVTEEKKLLESATFLSLKNMLCLFVTIRFKKQKGFYSSTWEVLSCSKRTLTEVRDAGFQSLALPLS